MDLSNISEDILGTIIKFLDLKDITNLSKTNKKFYPLVLLHYPFKNYKFLKLTNSDTDFNIILKNININPEVIFKTIIIGNKHKLLKNYLNKVDPSLDNNWAIRKASKKDYYEIVKLLLEDTRVDPSSGENWAIRSAVYNKSIKIVKLLLEDPRVNFGSNYSIITAIKNNDLPMVNHYYYHLH